MMDGAKAPANAVAESSGNTVREIREIKASREQGELHISLLADGPITDYRSFFLSGPPRLVIDLAGEWKRFSASRLKGGGETVKGIRIGRHPDRLRIVMDLKTERVQRPRFVESQEGLTITLTGQ
jgi:hypothetical protein